MVKAATFAGFGAVFAIGTVVAIAVFMIILGLVYFLINLWIVKFGSGLLGLNPDSSMVVLSAAVLTAAGLIGSSSIKRMRMF